MSAVEAQDAALTVGEKKGVKETVTIRALAIFRCLPSQVDRKKPQ